MAAVSLFWDTNMAAMTSSENTCLKPLFQSEAKCEAIDMKMILYSHANKTHFHSFSNYISLVLKKRVFPQWF